MSESEGGAVAREQPVRRDAFGPHIVNVDLLPIGAQRRDWLQTLISDGMVILRHRDLAATIHMADRGGAELR